jgi:hypothetical protein
MMRRVVNRRLVVLPVLAVAAMLTLAGCNNNPGTTGGSTGQPGSGGGNGSPSSSNNASGTASLKPCSLLTAADISQNQLGSGKSSNGNGARSCDWQNTTANNYAGYTLAVDVRDHQGLKDINSEGYNVTDDNIGSHQGKQLKQNPGSGCGVVIGVTNSSRVDVVATDSSGDAATSCNLANQFAKLVEPNLPSGG